MSKEQDEEDGSLKVNLEDPKKMKPNKKKFDEDMDGLTNQIKEKEAELERARQAASEIKRMRAERNEFVNKRKQIVIDLDRVNKEIPERMKRLNEIEASLYYKNEDKINSAIQRLEWNLRVKTYKLMEEKKIVSEIDSLRRSKKTLAQYLTLRQEISEIRERQKNMRDGRDRCTKEFNRLRSSEEELRSQNRSLIVIKKEIDALYEQRRQINANFKQQRGEFHELKGKQRKESWKKKAEERKAIEEEKRRELAEIEAERLPHESDLHTCDTLTGYLNRLLPSLTDTSMDSLSPASSQDDPEPAEEMDDGQFKLLKKSDDTDLLEHSLGGVRRLSKRNRRVRKHSMDKKIAHPSDVLSQFMSINLMAPACLYEVPDVLDHLEKKRSFFEKEQQRCEATSDAGISATSDAGISATSDAGISATESAVFAMSRQASKTESYEGGAQETTSRPDESVYADLFQQQETESGVLSDKDEELCGAVGGRLEEDDWSSVLVSVGSDTPNSDSTIEGDTGSGDSQKLITKPSSGDCGWNSRKDLSQENQELRKSLTITISNSTDNSSLLEQPAEITLVEEEFPSLLESSQSSLMSDVSFPSLGTSGCSVSQWQDSKQSTPVSVKGHSPLIKTVSLIPHDSNHNQMPKSKSYASSVVGRTRSFSEVMPKNSGNSANTNKSSDFSGELHVPVFSKQAQPPSSLSLSPSVSMNSPSTTPSSSRPKPSIHRSRTLTPTLTRSWLEVRDKHRKSGSGGNTAPSCGATVSVPTSSGTNSMFSRSSPKAQLSPSLSSSAIPSPHKSLLSPRLSYPLQSKPSLVPTQPMIVIDDEKDFPPLSQTTSNMSRRNSNLSNKSSSGSISLHDNPHNTSDNNNNNFPAAQQMSPACNPNTPTTTANFLSGHHNVIAVSTTQMGHTTPVLNIPENSDTIDSDLSLIPKGDKSSTEKWVESSMAFVQKDLTSCRLTEDLDNEVTTL